MPPKSRIALLLLALLAVVVPSGRGQSRPKIVDCLVASVNGQIITLTDLKIIDEFIFRPSSGVALDPGQVLEKVIEMKIIVASAKTEATVTAEEIEHAQQTIFLALGEERVKQRMIFYGLTAKDLETYLREKLLYEKIIASRSNQRVNVTLREIEAYYSEKYLGEQQAKGLPPQPLIEILPTIEARLRQEKLRRQLEEWVAGLKKQAVIRLYQDCLRYFERGGLCPN